MVASDWLCWWPRFVILFSMIVGAWWWWCLVVVVLGGRCEGVVMLLMVLLWDGEGKKLIYFPKREKTIFK